MIALLDVNVLVAMAWPNHVHHQLAHRWFAANQQAGWATCPGSQAGFVRVSSNHHVVPEARTPEEAVALLRRMAALPHHVFWDDGVSLVDTDLVDPARWVGYRQVTDGHLLAVALSHGGSLATLDRGVRAVVPPGFDPRAVVHVLTETVEAPPESGTSADR